jgi:hypothetical protein
MRFGRFDQSVYGATVTMTPDATYLASWLTDGRPGYPVKKTGGSLSATVTASLSVDMFSVINHNIKQAASIGLSGGVTNTISTAAWTAEGIPLNWVRVLTSPVSISSIGLSVTGNTDPVVVGEFYAGLSIEFPDFLHGRRFDPDRPFAWEGEYSSLGPYDSGVSAPRRVSGSIALDDTQYATLQEVFLSQRNGSRPVAWLEDDAVNDLWLAQFDYDSEHREGSWFINLEIMEIPRVRW